MKVSLPKSFLDLGVSRLQGTISEKNLAQIGLKADSNNLIVTASDRILAVFSQIPCETMEQGICYIPARLFSDVVRELPQSKVLLEKHGSFLLISAGEKQEFQIKIPIIEEGSWKDPPDINKDLNNYYIADLESEKIRYLIEQVQFCVSPDSGKEYGTVGFLHRLGSHSNNELLRLVSTDGFRLSYSEASFDGLSRDFALKGVSLSKRGLSEILRMTQEGFEKIQILISKDRTTLISKAPDYLVFIRLSAIEYPNYLGVFPEEIDSKMSEVIFSRSQFQGILRRVLLASDKSSTICLKISKESITLSSWTVGSSEGKENVSIYGYQGSDCEIKLNGKFLSEVLSVLLTENVCFKFKNERDPFLIIPQEEPYSCRSKHVMLPIIQN